MIIQDRIKQLNAWGVEPEIPYISVYKAIEQYVTPFDKEAVAKKVATKEGKTVEDIIQQWEFTRKWGAVKGLLIHQFIAQYCGGPFVEDHQVN